MGGARRRDGGFPWRWVLALVGVFAVGMGVGRVLRPAYVVRVLPVATRAAGAEKTVGGGSFVLATYNVHNFFDAYDNPYTADETTAPKTKGELKTLAAAIRQVDADVLILQEVEAGGALKAFVSEQLGDAGYKYVVDETTEDPRGITVAALSRWPVRRIVSHRLCELTPGGGGAGGAGAAGMAGSGGLVEGNRFARDLLRVDVEVRPGYVVTVYGVHLKSKQASAGDEGSAKWRLAEAVRAREIMQEEAGREGLVRFAFLGDCNDTIDSPAVQTVLGTTMPGMVDVLGAVPAGERVTFVSGGFREGIDHILLSPGLAARMAAGEIVRGGAVEKASDHRPVRVRIGLP